MEIPECHDGGLMIVSEKYIKDHMIRLDAFQQKFIGEVDLSGAIVRVIDSNTIETLEQDPIKGYCKDCKWWKDKDGVYRRGIGTESKCPINRIEVMEGRGYCFMFEPQES